MAKYRGCQACKHMIVRTASCAAFPNGIPQDILLAFTKHKEKDERQTGDTVWELPEDMEDA